MRCPGPTRRSSLVVPVLMVMLVPSLALAQTRPAPGDPARNERRLEITITGGGVSGGPGDELETAMRAAGLDDLGPGIFGDPKAHPFSRGGGGGSIDAHLRLRGPWSAGFVFSRTGTGVTIGMRLLPGILNYDNVFLDHGMTTIAALAGVGTRGVRLSAGPALHSVSIERSGGPSAEKESASKPGLLVQARATGPTRSRVFLAATAEYRLVGRMDVGPYPSAVATNPTLSARVPMAHFYFGGGLGIRF